MTTESEALQSVQFVTVKGKRMFPLPRKCSPV